MDANLGVFSGTCAELPEWPSPVLVCTMKMGFPGGSVVHNPSANIGDSGSILRVPGDGKGNPIQYFFFNLLVIEG